MGLMGKGIFFGVSGYPSHRIDWVVLMPSPALDEVYETYKHLDHLLSDPEWCQSDSAAIYAIAGEMWRALKAAREGQ
jgi:hypothetical protein